MIRSLRLVASVVMLCAAGFCVVGSAQAQASTARAWTDRDRIALGETAMLTVESSVNATPDYAPLLRDFDLGVQSSRQQLEWANGSMRASSQYSVALRPRRAGLLRIPPLRVGAQATPALTLLVTGMADATAPAGIAGRDVFIQSEADDQDPYVQQSVGWVVRLFTAVQAVSGELDQAEPDGASLQRVGNDAQYRRRVGGRDYSVVERHFLLVPERSGELIVPPATFRGRGIGNVFDRLFGDGQVDLQARAAPRILRVRPIPADAPQPWLPLRSLSMRYLETPRALRAGASGSIVVELVADGATASQMPPITLPQVPGMQSFPERAQVDESVVDGRPRIRLTRRFSIVPSQAGELRIEGPRLAWWDVQAARARTASLPTLVVQVAPGEPAAIEPRADPTTGLPASASQAGGALRWWGAAALLLVALVLIVMGVRRRHAVGTDTAEAMPERGPGPASSTTAPTPSGPLPPVLPSLPSALQAGDLGDIEHALRAQSPMRGDRWMEALADPAQRDAALLLVRARWADGDTAAAISALRAAFAAGVRWRDESSPPALKLAPLYPVDRPTRE